MRFVRRLGSAVGIVFVVVTLTFLLINLAPGDPARLWVGPAATQEDLDAAREVLGLDRPLPVRYVTWLMSYVTGDWGTSLAQNRPVTAVLLDALPHTILLTAGSLFLTYVLGIVLGTVQALRPRSRLDRGITVGSLAIHGMPSYWLAIMLVLVFAYGTARFGWPGFLQFPAMGVTSLDAEFLPWFQRIADRMRHLALPLATLALIGIAGVTRFARGSILDVTGQPFVSAGRARGLPATALNRRYVVRNALLPIITLLGLSLPALFSGTVFVEVIFAWPGMGREIVQAVAARDYPVVMAATTIFAVLVVISNGLADALYRIVDPRVRT